MENRNVLIALVLMLAVWTGYTMFFVKPTPPDIADVGPASVQQVVEQSAEEISATAAMPVVKTPAVVVQDDFKPTDITVDTDDYRAVFTNVGARLKSFELKHYRETIDPASGPVQLIGGMPSITTLDTLGEGDIALSVDSPYAVNVPGGSLQVSAGEEAILRFSTVLENGIIVEKNYRIKGQGYDLGLDILLNNPGENTLRGQLSLMLIQPWSDERDDSRYSFVGPAIFEDGELLTYKVKELEEEKVQHDKNPTWTAFEDKYFMTAAVPLGTQSHRIILEKTGDTVRNTIVSENLEIGANQTVSREFLLYSGPRDLKILEQINYDLDKAIDFGFFDMLARPLLSVLKFCYNNVIQNYGISIILLTVFIKILFWPLTHKSYKSMRDMQKLQPEMQRLREKYKKDKERMNREIMELYRNNRVNPMGGCLPMFAQIPVFFALYKVLLGSIALRHEPFMFWIHDLSAKDPYYITPLIMGATMFIQQKMSPTTMDSQQAKIMLFMPVVFTFMFLNFPSGLVIYWLVNNVLTIVQQWFINRGAAQAA
jgi:YidC/Oxa1 family membrane protein insertase